MSGPRPRIGIVGATRNERELRAFEAYVEAIEHACGEAVRVLAGTASGSVEGLDGVLLTGGPDVDPTEYGEATDAEASVEPDPLRDALELPLTRAAVHEDLPVLAICRGIQVLNVALGGTLYQDVDVQRDGRQAWSHQQRRSQPEAPLDAAVHDVDVVDGTRLAEIAGAPHLGVNTFHHQAIKQVAPDLVVTAWAAEPAAPGPDGRLIEAVEAPGSAFVVGVQWHPERMWKRDPAHARLFEALVSAAARRRTASTAAGSAGGRVG
jgi:putative glutamine amidotransferase